MGADGGVCWVPLRDPSKYNRVCELLRPFHFFTYMDDYHDSNYEWSDPIIRAPGYLIGTYGTDQEWSMYDDLPRVLDPESYEGEWYVDPAVTYGDLTFIELVEDLVTRPLSDGSNTGWKYINEIRYSYYEGRRGVGRLWDFHCKNISHLECMLWEVVWLYYKEADQLRTCLHPIGDMKVGEWMTEIRSLLHYNQVGHEETWT